MMSSLLKKEYRILVVEDVLTDFEIIENELKKSDIMFVLKQVKTKEEFLKELENFAPDLVITEYGLSKFNGLFTLTTVKDQYPDIPTIIVTGTLGDELAVYVMKCGATDYILKNKIFLLLPAVQAALYKTQNTRIFQELEINTMRLEIENKELQERELRIRKIQMNIEKIKDEISELAKNNL